MGSLEPRIAGFFMSAPDLKQQYGLPVIRISCDQTSGLDDIVLFFTAIIEGEFRDVALLHAAKELFGLPAHEVCEIGEMPHGPFQLPDFLVPSIDAALAAVPAGTPVWIEFVEPCGLLPVVPWEVLFAPFGHPVLRLPQQALMPETPSEAFDAVVCFSSPMSHELLPEDLVEHFVQLIPPDLARYATFHLFADAAVQPLLQAVRQRFGEEFHITIYDPEKAPPVTRSSTESSSSAIENPWLIWMRESMRGQSADVVHFLCHGYVRRGHGALALAESPVRNVNRNWSQFIFPGELSTFLNDVGAWSVAFSSPPGNSSPAGLRLLQHEIAQLRPGPVLHHDMTLGGPSDLGDTYRFLYTRDIQPPVLSPAISLYCHPYRAVTGISDPDDTSREVLSSYTLSGRVPGIKQRRWVASTQRILEQAAVRANAVEEATTQETRIGTNTALRWVADLVARHASVEDDPDSGGKDKG
jgi:hypothetical protein